MKQLIFTVLALPLLAGCWWNKKPDVMETTTHTFSENNPELTAKINEFEHLVGQAELDDEYLGKAVNGETEEK